MPTPRLGAAITGLAIAALVLTGCGDNGDNSEAEALEAALRACDTSDVPQAPQTARARSNPEQWEPLAEAWQDLSDEAGRAAILDPTWEPLFQHTNQIVGFLYAVGGILASNPDPNQNSGGGSFRFSPPSGPDAPDPFESEEWRAIAAGLNQECRRAALMAEDG